MQRLFHRQASATGNTLSPTEYCCSLMHVHIDVLCLYQDRVIGTNLTSTTTADSSGSGCQLESAGKNTGDFVEGKRYLCPVSLTPHEPWNS